MAELSGALPTWGNVASIFGLLVSIVGFVWTLIGVYRSKNAAEQATQAAESARKDIFRASAMIDLGAATSAMQEIKRLQREESWATLLDKYSALRANLITIRATRQDLDEPHLTAIQGAIAQFRLMEGQVERAVAKGQKLDAARLNAIVTDQLDRLSEVLGVLRSGKNG